MERPEGGSNLDTVSTRNLSDTYPILINTELFKVLLDVKNKWD